MANLRIGYVNHVDSATVTVSPAVDALGPASYLQNDDRSFMLATSTASQDVKLTWGGDAVAISQLTAWRHNLLASDTVRPIYYPNADWTGSPLYDPGASAAYASGLFDDWDWAFTNRYHSRIAGVKSAIVRIAASASPLELMRLGLFDYVEAPFNPEYGAQPGRDTNSKKWRTEAGSTNAVRKQKWRTFRFDMHIETEADWQVWDAISDYCGITESFVACLYPGVGGKQERNATYWATFDKHPGQKLTGWNQYDYSVQLSEL